MGYLIILIALFALMWLFLIRPQRRRQLEQARMQSELRPGDEVLTAGGIHGTVREVGDDVVDVEIAPGTVVKLDRRAVAAVQREDVFEADEAGVREPERETTVSTDGS